MTSLTYAILTQGNLKLHVITEDLSDDRYLERAAEGEAEYLEPLLPYTPNSAILRV